MQNSNRNKQWPPQVLDSEPISAHQASVENSTQPPQTAEQIEVTATSIEKNSESTNEDHLEETNLMESLQRVGVNPTKP